MIASVGDRITLGVGADEVKRLARPLVRSANPGRPTLAEMRAAGLDARRRIGLVADDLMRYAARQEGGFQRAACC